MVFNCLPRTVYMLYNLQYLSLTFDGTTGLVKSMTNIDKSITIDVSQSLMYYKAYQQEGQASGAYVFRPDGTDAFPVSTHVMISQTQV